MSELFPEIQDISSDSSLWGGKATNLSKFAKAGIAVPPGIVIGTEWFRKYRDALLHSDNSIEHVFHNLQRNIQMASGWSKIDKEPLIVRSSANLEGTSKMSFSGFFESIVVSEQINLFKAIKKVWDCVNNAEVSKYLELHATTVEIEMAIIIHKFIKGEFAGVMLTRDIVNEHDDHLVIEYEKWREGSVVDGKETTYSVIIDRNNRYVLKDESHGDLDHLMPKLFDSALECEDITSTPLELEWVSTADEIWIVQGRPVEFCQ